MKYLLAMMLLFAACHLTAQEKLKFHSQNYVGVLDGAKGTSMQLHSINGFQRGTWFGGIGMGLDYYYFRTIPLFLSANKFFCNCGRSLFASADAGINFFWDEKQKRDIRLMRDTHFNPSLYLAGGIGYQISLKNKDALLLNVGYSYKHIREKAEMPVLCIVPPCPTYVERYDYRLRRLSLKVGWRF